MVDIQVEGSTVTIYLGVCGDAGITMAILEGRSQRIAFPLDRPPIFIFHNVAASRYTIRVTDDASHAETEAIIVP